MPATITTTRGTLSGPRIMLGPLQCGFNPECGDAHFVIGPAMSEGYSSKALRQIAKDLNTLAKEMEQDGK